MKNKININKILILDKNFIPCPVNEDDELFNNGIFQFNITKMIEFIHSHLDEFIPESISVKEYFEYISSINENYLDSVKISDPVLLAEIAPGKYNLIDGNHRLGKAYKTGMENIMAYKLRVKHHIRFLTTQKVYAAYIEYWNSKLSD